MRTPVLCALFAAGLAVLMGEIGDYGRVWRLVSVCKANPQQSIIFGSQWKCRAEVANPFCQFCVPSQYTARDLHTIPAR